MARSSRICMTYSEELRAFFSSRMKPIIDLAISCREILPVACDSGKVVLETRPGLKNPHT